MGIANYFRNFSVFTFGSFFIQIGIFFRDLIVAQQIGLSTDLDYWTMIWAGSSFIIGTLTGSLSGFLVPYIQSQLVLNQFPKYQLNFFIKSVLVKVLYLSLAISLYQYLNTENWSLSFRFIILTLSFGIMIFNILIGFERALLLALNQVRFCSLSPLISVLSSLLVFIIFIDQLSILKIAIGLFIGFALEYFIMQYKSQQFFNRYEIQNSNLKMNDSIFWNLLIAGVVTALGSLLDQFMISYVLKEGNAGFSYGTKLSSVIINFMGGFLSLVVFPRISQEYQDTKSFKSLKKYGPLFSLFSFLFTLVLALIGHTIIDWLFVRGQFLDQHGQLVYHVHRIYVWHIPFYLIGILGLQMLQIKGYALKISKIAFGGLFFKVLLNLILGEKLGLEGFAWSTVGFYFLTCSLIWITIYKQKLYLAEQ